MNITRHFLDVAGRQVHYRKAGNGPPLLMIHQSPRSSAEFEPLLAQWAEHFTCIAPDTPGFGLSDPLPIEAPSVGDFANALIETIGALGLDRVAAYGVHSGGMIVMSAIRRAPALFTVGAIAGYPVWTPEEMARFGEAYLPPFTPKPYGEHLAWLWGRIVEQSWFFPWYVADPRARLPFAHNDVARINGIVHEMLDSGDAYRAGYGAVLRAESDVPPADAAMPPVLIAGFKGDPLEAHLARLGPLPAGWEARSLPDKPTLEATALQHLRAVETPVAGRLVERADEGFTDLAGGRLHWRGDRTSNCLVLHSPGGGMQDAPAGFATDLPGHGLSGEWALVTLDDWVDAIASLVEALGLKISVVTGHGLSALLALAVAKRLGVSAEGVSAHIPRDSTGWIGNAVADVTPDRHGAHLLRAWSIVRASHFFWPWFDACAANAIPFATEDVAPEKLALEHRNAMRARQGVALADLLLTANRDALVAGANITAWHVEDWATTRDDIWQPSP